MRGLHTFDRGLHVFLRDRKLVWVERGVVDVPEGVAEPAQFVDVSGERAVSDRRPDAANLQGHPPNEVAVPGRRLELVLKGLRDPERVILQ